MTLKKECFEKSVKHDYKILAIVCAIILGGCGVIYATNYVSEIYGAQIASVGTAISGFVGGICTVYNLCCFLTIGATIWALASICKSSKKDDQECSNTGGLYFDVFLAAIAQIVVIIVYEIFSYAVTLKQVCYGGSYWWSCAFVSSGISPYPIPWIPLTAIVVLIIASPATVAYARCKE